jgi:MFS family permease
MRIRTGSLSMGLRALRSAPPWVTLVVCCVGQFMVILDVMIVNVALPQMRHDLGLSVSAQEWVVNAYTLAFAGFLMLGGRAADLWGRRRIFLIGIAVFTVASLTGGLAANGLWLITARAVQGLGAAMLAPATLSLLTSRFTDPHERRKALSAWSTTSASGAAVGVLAGGILTGLLSWRWVLFVNIPVGIAVIVPALLAVSEPRVDGPRARLDILGTGIAAAGLIWIAVTLAPDVAYLSTVLGPLILFGCGIGVSFGAMAMAATHGVPAHQAGLASGLLNTTRQVGGATGLAVMATAASSLTNGLSGSHSSAAALTEGYKLAFLIAGLGLAAGMLLAFALPTAARERRDELPVPATAPAGTPSPTDLGSSGFQR